MLYGTKYRAVKKQYIHKISVTEMDKQKYRETEYSK